MIGAAVLFFQNRVSALNGVGMGLATLGVTLYSHAVHNSKSDAAADGKKRESRRSKDDDDDDLEAAAAAN